MCRVSRKQATWRTPATSQARAEKIPETHPLKLLKERKLLFRIEWSQAHNCSHADQTCLKGRSVYSSGISVCINCLLHNHEEISDWRCSCYFPYSEFCMWPCSGFNIAQITHSITRGGKRNLKKKLIFWKLLVLGRVIHSVLDLHSRGNRFDSRPGYKLFWLGGFLGFLNLLIRMIGHDRLLPNHWLLIIPHRLPI